MAQPGLLLRVTAAGSAPPVRRVQVSSAAAGIAARLRWVVQAEHVAALVPSTASATSTAAPITVRGQRLRWVVRLGGEEVPAAYLVHPVRVTLDRGGMDTWAFGLRLSGRWPVRFPRRFPSATVASLRPSLTADACGPLGTETVDIALEVAPVSSTGSGGAGGRRTYPLITGGLAGQTEEDVAAGVQRIRGFGPLARYDAVTLDASLAAGSSRGGSNKPRGVLLAGWLRAVGVPLADLPDATPVQTAVNVAGASALGFATQFLRPALLRLGATPEGELRAYPTHQVASPSAAAVPRWRFGAGDLLANALPRLSASHDQPTELVVTGQLYAGEDGCGTVTTLTPRLLYGPYAPSTAYFFQIGSFPGATTLTPLLIGGGSADAKHRLTSAVYVERVERCGLVLEESVLTTGWKLRQVPRYGLRPDGTIQDQTGVAQSGYLHNPDAVWGDESPLYATDREGYTAIQRVRRRFEYDEASGYLLRTVEEVDGWRARRGALRERPEASSVQGWDELEVLDGVTVWADGTRATAEVWHGRPVGTFSSLGAAAGVVVNSSAPEPVSRTVVEVATDALGYTLSRTTRRYGWAPRPGSRYLYAEGETYGSPWEEFGLLETQVESYEPEGEGRHRAVSTRRDELTGDVFVEDGQQAGYRPATPRDLSVLGDEDAASRPGASQPAEYRVAADFGGAEGLEECRIARQLVVDLPYAQNEDDLERFARAELARLYGLRCQFAVPANPLLRKDDVVEILYPGILPLRVHLETVETRDDGDARPQVVTVCTGTVYPASTSPGAEGGS